MASKFRNAGQTCVCANRLYVQDGVYARFAEKLQQAVEQLQQVIASHWHYSVAQWLGVNFGPDAGWLSMMGPVSYTHLDVYKRQG